MSYTEITFFGQDGCPKKTEEVRNAWRGAMAVWNIMDERYLSAYIPDWALRMGSLKDRYYRTSDQEEIKKIWALWDNETVPELDKIALGSTFDWVVVTKEDIPKLLTAFRSFEGTTSLPEQADIIEEAFKDSEIVAVAWNQTSVCQNNWKYYTYDEETETETPYNLLSGEKHWNLFDSLYHRKKEVENESH